jgi:hypothetical protein
MKDFSFQGKVYLGTRQSNGKPGALQWVDDASVLQIKLAADVSTRQESYSGNRLPSARLSKSKSATLTLTLSAFLANNLALGLYGQSSDVAGGSITSGQDLMPAGLQVGDVVALKYGNVSAFTLKDSASGSPASLDLGTDYEIESAAGGLIKLLNVTGFTQPFDPAYTYADGTNLAMFTQPAPERYLLLDGVNTVEGDSSPVRVELYRVVFDPISTLDLISDDFGTLELTGSVLYDSTNAADANLGGFGKLLLPAEA